MRCTIVSHTHWDREWYRSFQSFRARLVDTVDCVLDLVAQDPDYHFQLDGQSIAVEDYLAIRPERRAELEAACRAGQVAIGPWYVQPDSLLPSGESHVRNLLEGRRVAREFGEPCQIAYTPDSFGHPAQFPQLFSGFGLGPFIYWRGNGDEIMDLGSEYRWQAPDGSEVLCCHLAKGYFPAWGFGDDVSKAAARLETLAVELRGTASGDSILLMNGLDHVLPDENTREVAEALAKATGWQVERGLLDHFVESLAVDETLPSFKGELLAGRLANLLPGVWSSRMNQKLENRACEAGLEGWAEPWAALGSFFGTPDERPALRRAWRALLANQAHDSICGCSKDAVHEEMEARYTTAFELANETTQRTLERLAGLGIRRQLTPPDPDPKRWRSNLAVFNPSPHARSDLVRLPLDGFPPFTPKGVSPLLGANIGARGLAVDGRPARLIEVPETERPSPIAGQRVFDVEFVAREIPAFGMRRFELSKCPAEPDEVDEGRQIEVDALRVKAESDGSFTLESGNRVFSGLAALHHESDRGDTYDFDPIPNALESSIPIVPNTVKVTRRRHSSGIQELEIERILRIPASLDEDRAGPSGDTRDIVVTTLVRIAEGIARVDLETTIENTARDLRLRMSFPSGETSERFDAATTFDRAARGTAPRSCEAWIHPAPSTFPHQGWVCVNGLTVAAPGLYEAEVSTEGRILITLLRATGWLSRDDLTSRPGGAGPALATPGAQCQGRSRSRISLFTAPLDAIPGLARDAELGLRAVPSGPDLLLEADHSLLRLEPEELVLSALKPADWGPGVVARVLNPSDAPLDASLHLGFEAGVAHLVRLDETQCGDPAGSKADLEVRDGVIRFPVPPHALRTILITRKPMP